VGWALLSQFWQRPEVASGGYMAVFGTVTQVDDSGLLDQLTDDSSRAAPAQLRLEDPLRPFLRDSRQRSASMEAGPALRIYEAPPS
jgi:hypothetical protein